MGFQSPVCFPCSRVSLFGCAFFGQVRGLSGLGHMILQPWILQIGENAARQLGTLSAVPEFHMMGATFINRTRSRGPRFRPERISSGVRTAGALLPVVTAIDALQPTGGCGLFLHRSDPWTSGASLPRPGAVALPGLPYPVGACLKVIGQTQ